MQKLWRIMMGRPKGSKNKTTKLGSESNPAIFVSMSKTTEQVAEEEMKRAAEKGWDEPDFDFRKLYHSGDTIYYVYLNHLTGDKELFELHVRTVYARSLIAWEDGGCARIIGYPNRDWIFWDRREAETYYKTAKVEAIYGNKEGLY